MSLSIISQRGKCLIFLVDEGSGLPRCDLRGSLNRLLWSTDITRDSDECLYIRANTNGYAREIAIRVCASTNRKALFTCDVRHLRSTQRISLSQLILPEILFSAIGKGSIISIKKGKTGKEHKHHTNLC